jgi:hypothetical protein
MDIEQWKSSERAKKIYRILCERVFEKLYSKVFFCHTLAALPIIIFGLSDIIIVIVVCSH